MPTSDTKRFVSEIKLSETKRCARGEFFVFDTSHRIVEFNLNREVRCCFNCQRYGHTQHNCKAQFSACGKCASRHRTKGCTENKDAWKCVNCSGAHQSDHRDCSEQIKVITRYRTSWSLMPIHSHLSNHRSPLRKNVKCLEINLHHSKLASLSLALVVLNFDIDIAMVQ